LLEDPEPESECESLALGLPFSEPEESSLITAFFTFGGDLTEPVG